MKIRTQKNCAVLTFPEMTLQLIDKNTNLITTPTIQ